MVNVDIASFQFAYIFRNLHAIVLGFLVPIQFLYHLGQACPAVTLELVLTFHLFFSAIPSIIMLLHRGISSNSVSLLYAYSESIR